MLFSLTLVSAAVLAVAASPTKNGRVSIQKAHGQRIHNSYIVTLKPSADKDQVMSAAEADGESKATHVRWNPKVYHGFAGTFSEKAINKLREDPDVKAIEEDVMLHTSVTTTKSGSPWGLQRISQTSKLNNQNDVSLSFSYQYDSKAGNGTDVYVIDTGINTAHVEFGGRAFWGKTFGGYADKDGNGHGTHVAGTAISNRYGVAKLARAYAVKVLADDGSGALSDVLSGITWAVTRAQTSGRPSVINLSLGGGASTALDQAVNSAIARGVHVAVAAGNDGEDASQHSPARAVNVTAVGASAISDAFASFSNFGASVDIIAPGVDVISTWIGSNTAVQVLSGTSMATPHIAGLTAYYISVNGNVSPIVLRGKLQDQAVKSALKAVPSGTKNYLANNGIGQ